MYISNLKIKNFRCLSDISVTFRQGLNVIVGENNAGKSALLQGIRLIFDRSMKKPSVEDFCNAIVKLDEPPSITVEATIQSSGAMDALADQAVVATWLTKLDAPWEATLTYHYFLPEEHHAQFKKDVGLAPTSQEFWRILEIYTEKYVARIYGGQFDAGIRADVESLEKFSCQFLDAIRDVNAELFSATNPLLKRMLRQILDRNLKEEDRKKHQGAFRAGSDDLLKSLLGRLDLKYLFDLVEKTGAGDGGKPTLSGRLSELDLLASLKLMIEAAGQKVPATHNGLGYNNLIYISLLLRSMEVKVDQSISGQNAVVFPILLVEEPEAHLHPSLQYKLLKYIQERIGIDKFNRQVFLTTHSTQITSASALDCIICMQINDEGGVAARYPGRVFDDNEEGRASKKYVERYLDATKSNMLFSKSVLFVEGLAEQLLLPTLARSIKHSLEDKHVALVAVGGLTFKHFLPLFGVGVAQSKMAYALRRRVACVLDADPSRLSNVAGSRWMSCYPYELDVDTSKFKYQAVSAVAKSLKKLEAGAPLLCVRYGQKTFEYDLAFANGASALLLTEALRHLKALQELTDNGAPDNTKIEALLSQGTREALQNLANPAGSEAQHRFATYYLVCAENAKGEHAFDLALRLNENLDLSEQDRKPFQIPIYIKEALEWTCDTLPKA